MTSVTLRLATRSKLKQAITDLAPVRGEVSEQRLMRACVRLAIRLWRGKSQKARRNRLFNRKQQIYAIVPFYSTEALRAVAQARCHFSGLSFSRLMDFAIRCYLGRIVTEYLAAPFYWRDAGEVAFSQKQLARRKKIPPFVINYLCIVSDGADEPLCFTEKLTLRLLQ